MWSGFFSRFCPILSIHSWLNHLQIFLRKFEINIRIRFIYVIKFLRDMLAWLAACSRIRALITAHHQKIEHMISHNAHSPEKVVLDLAQKYVMLVQMGTSFSSTWSMLSYFYVDWVLLQLRVTANIARVDEKLVHMSTSSLTVVLAVAAVQYELYYSFTSLFKQITPTDLKKNNMLSYGHRSFYPWHLYFPANVHEKLFLLWWLGV